MRILVTGAVTELGRETNKQLIDAGHHVTGLIRRQSEAAIVESDGGHPLIADPANAVEMERALQIAEVEVVLNLAPQKSNTLLHDGQGWRSLGRKQPRRIPTWAVRFAPVIAGQQVQQLKLHAAQVDNGKARRLLDWNPQFPSCREGLAQTVRVWREAKK